MIKMKLNLRQELSKQWFKNLQDIICKNIEEKFTENFQLNSKVKFQGQKRLQNFGHQVYLLLCT